MSSTDLRSIIVSKIMEMNDAWVISVDSVVSSGLQLFREKKSHRFVELGVAEQNAVDVACGLASEGAQVFVFGISSFLLFRAYEQIRTTLGIGQYSVCICGIWAGLHYSDQGLTHRQTEDIAILRTIPNLTAYSPYGATNCIRLLDAIAEKRRPAYLRIEDPSRNSHYLEETSGSSVAVTEIRNGHTHAYLATGQALSRCFNAAERGALMGYHIGVIAISQLFPLSSVEILAILRKYKHVHVIEEHYMDSGLAADLLRLVSEERLPLKITFQGVGTEYPGTMAYEGALAHYHLDEESIFNDLISFIDGA
ncbi:transketolase C-terminal domain-containing protein [Burkholderia sp. BCC1630]|uniref:transketolase C-terminal domain-containing protein n=1 Tax=Burkholderia sp. BCC1630 TaxID=2676304 RepID=UPI00158F2524|nr:transketolase C-terminal domain-containing protein [Burkholderia sp. BCC1630]